MFFGLQTQAQFIANPCDSVDVSFTSSAFSVDLEATIPSSYLATSWNWVSVSNSLNQVDSTQMITLIVSPIIDTTYVTLTMTVLDSSGMIYTCVKSYLVFPLATGGYGMFPAGQSSGGTVITIGPGGLGTMSPHCDSINIVVDPMSTTTNVVLNANATTLPGIVNTWYWDVYDYNGFVQTSSTQSVNFTASTTDTFMVFLETSIVNTNLTPYICLHFGSVYYNGSAWVFTSAYLPVGPTNPGGGSTGGGGIGNTFAICDSLAVGIDPSATYANPVFIVNVGNTTATVLDNQWQAFDNNGNFYADSTLLFSFTNTAPSDTIAVFVMATIPYNGILATCMAFDMLVFGNNGWVSMRVGGSATGIEDLNTFLSDRKLLKIVDVLGRETKEIKNSPMFYIYNDRTVERKMIVE